jgi:hypothetical protein
MNFSLSDVLILSFVFHRQVASHTMFIVKLAKKCMRFNSQLSNRLKEKSWRMRFQAFASLDAEFHLRFIISLYSLISSRPSV